ncbi:MAG: S-adenosylmethionine:tRNA ribosyltransferase-isomerase [Candidatus Gracilibacteria bacterium]|nr:S-adenosylmethionine:tRNA ribosyltransferase-isomerase [Candidatus Gracilibacteria bacterium]
MSLFDLKSYHYELPSELIAQEATHPHHDARLIVVDKKSGNIEHEGIFLDLAKILENDRVLFFNNSRVLPARIPLNNREILRPDGTSGTITDGEILFCQKLPGDTFEALVRPGAKFRIGTRILFPEGEIEVVAVSESGRILRAHGVSIEYLMEKYGELPLPPYIEYTKEKEKDYQTSFADKNGSVAAPTASLHFTQELLEKIHIPKEYVTLHVGLGTFKGIDVEDIREYQIHQETIEIELVLFEKIASYKKQGRKLIAVGTTVCRTLESLPSLWQSLDLEAKEIFDTETTQYWDTLSSSIPSNHWIDSIILNLESGILNFSTSIYITPGYQFQVVDELITNFHLPESSLLVLVSAFAGKENREKLYRHAIHEKYRFFSFGDGIYIRGK